MTDNQQKENIDPIHTPMLRFPPFPVVPDGFEFIPFNSFRPSGIRVPIDDDDDKYDGQQVSELIERDGLGIPEPRIQGNGFVLVLKPSTDRSNPSANPRDRPMATKANNTEGNIHSTDDEDGVEKHLRQIFCPPDLRQPIIDMMERHYCAHP